MRAEPPAQLSRLGLRGRIHGVGNQRLVRFDTADDGADQFVSSRCREIVSGILRHQNSICNMGAPRSSYRSWLTVSRMEVRCSGQGGVVVRTYSL